MSLYQDILDQVTANITALTLTGDPVVRRRKKFVVLENEGPQIIVTPTVEQEVEDEEGFENVITMRYGVLIGIAIPTDGELLNSENLMYTYRQTIRRALYDPSAVALSEPCTGVSIDPRPPFDLGGARDNQNISAMMISYDICEPRFEV